MAAATHILILHGAIGSAKQMEPVASELARLGTVHNIELPGHGETPLREGEEFSIGGFVRALRHEISSIRHSTGESSLQFDVFGYSMGGYVALALESEAPGTVATIVTLGTKFAWSPALALRELSRLDPNIIQEKIPKFVGVLESRHTAAGGWKLVLEHTGKLLTELGDGPILTKESLAKVTAQVTVAVGSADDTVSIDEASEFASYMPNATAQSLPDIPHPIERVPAALIASLVGSTRSRK